MQSDMAGLLTALSASSEFVKVLTIFLHVTREDKFLIYIIHRTIGISVSGFVVVGVFIHHIAVRIWLLGDGLVVEEPTCLRSLFNAEKSKLWCCFLVGSLHDQHVSRPVILPSYPICLNFGTNLHWCRRFNSTYGWLFRKAYEHWIAAKVLSKKNTESGWHPITVTMWIFRRQDFRCYTTSILCAVTPNLHSMYMYMEGRCLFIISPRAVMSDKTHG